MQIAEDAAVRRLVARLGLGPTRDELATASGFDATLDALTLPGVGADPGIAATPMPSFPTVDRRQRADRKDAVDQGRQLAIWWLDRMVAVTRPFPERLTWFWHGHFATSIQKVRQAGQMAVQNATLRRLGGGDFRDLARAMVLDPAMLVWLDGTGNRVGKPNENLAREFMELFTLGVGHYTEDDVKQAARALTGATVDASGTTASLDPRRHDPGPETVLGTTAAFDPAGLADLLVDVPVSPQFVAGRVWTRFVSDTPPSPATRTALLDAYGPRHDVTALVRAAARSPEFRDPGSVLARQPVEWLVAALRALKLPASAVPTAALAAGLTALGQVPFRPPDVGGWPAGAAWLTTASALGRMALAQRLAVAGDFSPVTDAPQAGRVEATAALLGLPRFTDRTAAALAPLAGDPPRLVAAALAGPEMAVSA